MALEGTLDASVRDDSRPTSVEFAFTVTNHGRDPVEVQFTDGAKAEFVVIEDGQEVWRFTEGRLFTQMLSTERLEPGETRTHEATWENPIDGTFTAVGELRARETTCEARTEFTLTDQ